MEEQEKVTIKLHKELLESERKELKEKRKRKFLIFLLCFLMLVSGLVGGFALSSALKGSSTALFKKDKFDKILTYFDALWLYKNDYDDLKTTMEDKAFYGMTRFEDDVYSSYMSKEEIADFQKNINMNYVGIGAQYSFTGGVGTITRVFKGSPAEAGGMLPGDIIYKVDDQTLEGLDSDQIKERITGEEGTTVKVTVLRSGKEIELTMHRAPIEYTVYAEQKDDYIILEIMSFGDTTADECIRYLDEYQGYSKLIIDLRDNSGGYQDSVQKVAGLFIGKDKVVLQETDSENVTESYKTIVEKYYDNFKKIIVLTNKNTASAAEVLSICLKEQHENATLVGETTYGKGVVQKSFYLEDGSALKITSSYWSSPNGVSINKEGVKPDVEVKLDPVLYETAYAMEEDDKYEYDSVSNFVKVGEEGLKFLDYNVDRVDGYFDEAFKDALLKYKQDNGLVEDSILDYETYNAIISSVIREYNNNPNKDYQMMKAKELLKD